MTINLDIRFNYVRINPAGVTHGGLDCMVQSPRCVACESITNNQRRVMDGAGQCRRCQADLTRSGDCPNCYGLIDVSNDQELSKITTRIDGVEAVLRRGLPPERGHDETE